ncbi:hypothetical protein ACHAXR_010969 [Thalassiosira sp. AJA248-18]
MNRSILFLAGILSSSSCALAFAPSASFAAQRTAIPSAATDARVAPLHMSDEDEIGLSSSTQEKIKSLVDDNPVLLFMKGNKLFPQCGFSNTACQILQSYNIDFESVDVLADEAIRQGVKDFSQWPTIPQLYVCGEFIGGSDIMIEMYQSGELGEMIEKAKADMI